MMRSLSKYVLDYKKTLPYFKDHIQDGNALSLELLAKIDFESGTFFTLLPPEEANFQHLYDFRWGGILPSGPMCKLTVGSREYRAEKKNTLKSEIGQLIFELIGTPNNSCVFEDVTSLPTDSHLELFNSHGLLYKNEIYYSITKENVKEDNVIQFISEADSLWHFVCVITHVIVHGRKDHEISLDDIKLICSHVKLIIVGAYDGEGYLFWEPNS